MGWKHWPVYFAVALGASLAVLAKPLGIEVWIAVVGICALHGLGQFWIAQVARHNREVDPLPKLQGGMVRLDLQGHHAHHTEGAAEYAPETEVRLSADVVEGVRRPTGVADAMNQAIARTSFTYHTARAPTHDDPLPGNVDLPAHGQCVLGEIPTTVDPTKDWEAVDEPPATVWERLVKDDD